MKTRTPVWLALIAAFAIAAALWSLSARTPQQDVGLQGPLLPGLTSRLNEIEQVKVVGAGSTTLATLQRRESGWTLAERGDYPVDAGKLRALLVNLADARKVEAKTSNPELYDRLSVEDIDADDAQGVALEISGGGSPVGLIVGGNNSRGKGTYVRTAGDAASWLIDLNIAVERNPVEWLQRELVNIPTSRVASVSLTTDSGERIEIGREDGAGGDFRVQNMPRGREPLSEFVADATAGLLDNLRFDDVLTADAVAAIPTDAREARYSTVEGLTVTVRFWKVEDKTYGSFSAELDDVQANAWANAEPADLAAETAAAADGSQTPDTDSAASAGDGDNAAPQQKLTALQAELASLQQRFNGRSFILPAFKASSIERDMEAFLKPKQ